MFLPLHYQNRKVAQLVAHYVRDVGVGRSSRLFPTEKRGYILYSLFFLRNLISEMPPLSDRKEGVSKRRTFSCAKPHKRNVASFRQKREDIFYILSFFCAKPHKRNAASFRQKREDIFYILSFFVQNLISEMPPLSDRKRVCVKATRSLFLCKAS